MFVLLLSLGASRGGAPGGAVPLGGGYGVGCRARGSVCVEGARVLRSFHIEDER
ncbi:hypothetical protein [Austwickia chelonae]|uniref:hypothetical protein n=1 Tax=Austwickia chelonae TaxID=100225 RepID=UPI0013C2FA54|nr:hypothetical protein [Austwickia chelonae]